MSLFITRALTAVLLLASSPIAIAQTFTDVTPPGIVDLWYGATAWGDYDQDGDLDFLVLGLRSNNITFGTVLYENTPAGFVEVTAAQLPGLVGGSADWGDYDNDGDLDLLLSGGTVNDFVGKQQPITRVYRNLGGGRFQAVQSAVLPGLHQGEAKWGDYNNDGRLDIVLAGHLVCGIYKNEVDGTFSELPNLNLPFLSQVARVSWSDYDNDGDLDLFFSGWGNNLSVGRLVRNDGQDRFTDVTPAVIQGQHRGDAAWTDVDSDGDLDLFIGGLLRLDDRDQNHSKLYLNTNGTFAVSAASSFWVVEDGMLAWGDADNDGAPDLLLTSGAVTTTQSILYSNQRNGTFQPVAHTNLVGFDNGDAAWGDYDNDGDLDLLLIGRYNGATKVYRNDVSAVNQRPAAPAATSLSPLSGGEITLHWTAGSDDHTPAAGLSYNVYVGKASSPHALVAAQANVATGYRYLPALGNAGLNRFLPVRDLPGGRYVWGVQAVDNGFLGSTFVSGQPFIVPLTASVSLLSAACAGTPVAVTYKGNAAPTAQFNWDFGGGHVLSGSGRGPYLVQWATDGLKTVSVSVTDDNLTAPPAAAQVRIDALPTARLDGDSIICASPAQLRVTLTGTPPWTLTYRAGAGLQVATGIQRSPYELLVDSAGTCRILALRDGNGCGGSLSPDSIVVRRCVQQLAVFPNPSQGSVLLGTSPSQDAGGVVTLWDVQGKPVYRASLTGLQLGSPLLLPVADGLYMLELVLPGRVQRQKVVVQR